MGKWLSRLFNEHMLVRRTIVFWAIWLVTVVVLKFVSLMTEINTATVTGVGTIIGILSTVLAFYIKLRELDGK